MKVFVETGSKRAFAGAIDWPGLARGARTADEALAALVAYAPRYSKSLAGPARAIEPPIDAGDLDVVERLKGGSGTDFGVPSSIADFDRAPVTGKQLERLVELLRASWDAFEKAAATAKGRTLAKGPRGGERWPARYAIRRSAWHALDHAWEIEDRS